jgi:DNA-binding PadR family transcriptional regulator
MTNAELAILSLIAEQDRHGYEIEQVIEARGMREWTQIGFSSIYYLLKRLEQYGWIASRERKVVGQGGPRKVYSITPDGKEIFEHAVLEALSTAERDPDNFQLGLANITWVPKARSIEALNIRLRELERQAEHVRGRRAVQAPLPLHVEGMFDLSLNIIASQIEWLRGFTQSWEKNDGQD